MTQCDFFDCKDIAIAEISSAGVEGGPFNICESHQHALKSPRVTYEVDMKAHKLRMYIEKGPPENE